jgi:cell division transport system permease protein
MQKPNSKKKLGNYPSLGVIASITLALFVTGIIGILIIYSQELERLVRENVRMQVYLKNGLTETQRLQVEKSIEALPYLNTKQAIQFVSKTEAAEKFIAETGEDFNQFLGENPLHDAYLVTIDPAYQSAEELKKVQDEIKKINGVYQVFYVEGLIESINRNVTRVGLVLAGIVGVLLVTVVLLINNTIRLALFSQRFLIRSMQLVGAKRWFIKWPFLLRALVYGLFAGVLASGGLWVLLRYANSKIEDLSLLMNTQNLVILMLALLVLGMLVAVISTYFSIRKYLKMSLDELY